MANRKTWGRRPDTSLWRQLSEGSADFGAQLIVSVAAGALLTALACAAAFLVASASVGSRVDDEVILFCFFIAALVYVGVLYWIWSRSISKRAVLLTAAVTIGLWLIVGGLSILVANVLRSGEVLATSFFFAGAGATVMLWLTMWRRFSGGKSLRTVEGEIDVRCPTCDYSMVGLSTTECPECGQHLTIDQLIAKQNYEALAPKTASNDLSGDPEHEHGLPPR